VVSRYHNLGIRIGEKVVAERFQFLTKFYEVVDFAVVGDPVSSAKFKRLLPGFTQIENRQPPVTQTDRPINVDALAIRTTVTELVD
jgi:hypothetical protein